MRENEETKALWPGVVMHPFHGRGSARCEPHAKALEPRREWHLPRLGGGTHDTPVRNKRGYLAFVLTPGVSFGDGSGGGRKKSSVVDFSKSLCMFYG